MDSMMIDKNIKKLRLCGKGDCIAEQMVREKGSQRLATHEDGTTWKNPLAKTAPL